MIASYFVATMFSAMLIMIFIAAYVIWLMGREDFDVDKESEDAEF